MRAARVTVLTREVVTREVVTSDVATSAAAARDVTTRDVTTRAPHASRVVPDELTKLRDAIEQVDDALITLLAERQSLAKRVGATKRAAGLAVVDPAREAGVVRRAAERARCVGLPPDAVRELFRRLIALSREQQLG